MAFLLKFVETVYLCLKIRAPGAMWFWFCSDFKFSYAIPFSKSKRPKQGLYVCSARLDLDTPDTSFLHLESTSSGFISVLLAFLK